MSSWKRVLERGEKMSRTAESPLAGAVTETANFCRFRIPKDAPGRSIPGCNVGVTQGLCLQPDGGEADCGLALATEMALRALELSWLHTGAGASLRTIL
jgi:hypothetical protein